MFDDLKKHVTRDLAASSALPPGVPQPRVGGAHASLNNWTPPYLRELIPGAGSLTGVSVVWQATENSFQGYYRGGHPRASTSAAYGGPCTPADPAIALDHGAHNKFILVRHLTLEGRNCRNAIPLWERPRPTGQFVSMQAGESLLQRFATWDASDVPFAAVRGKGAVGSKGTSEATQYAHRCNAPTRTDQESVRWRSACAICEPH